MENIMELISNDCSAEQVVLLLDIPEVEVSEILDLLKNNQKESFWKLILTKCQLFVKSLSNEEVVHLLTVVVRWLKCALLTDTMPNFVAEVIVLLSQSVLVFNDVQLIALQNSIATLCEMLWLKDLQGSEIIATYTIPFSLQRCVVATKSVRDINLKRLWNMRGAFLLLNLMEFSLNDLIVQFAVNSDVLQSNVGAKTVVYLMNLENGALVEAALFAFKQRMVVRGHQPTTVISFGHTLYNSWKDAVSSGRLVVKQCVEDCLQDLVKQAIHADSIKCFKLLRALVQASLGQSAASKEVSAMILRVYAPILWRSLKCANAVVRSQACVMFFDVFPLHRTEGSAEEDDAMLQMQFDSITALLKDRDHRVRAHAVTGVCDVLVKHWDTLLPHTISGILQNLINKLVKDSSSALVRQTVLRGIARLVAEQPQSHSVLKELLPLLRDRVHDHSDLVRTALLHLLSKVSHVRGMHFYDVVPLDSLLEQMVLDANLSSPSEAATSLLLSSFFPTSDEDSTGAGATQIRRCIKFAKVNVAAAEVFYRELPNVVSSGRAVKFLAMLFSQVFPANSSTAAKSSNSGLIRGKRGRHQSPQSTEDTPSSDQLTQDHVLRVIIAMLRTLLERSERGSVAHEAGALLVKYFPAERMINLIKSTLLAPLQQKRPKVRDYGWVHVATLVNGIGSALNISERGQVPCEDCLLVLKRFVDSCPKADKSISVSRCAVAGIVVEFISSTGHKAMLVKFIGDSLQRGVDEDHLVEPALELYSHLVSRLCSQLHYEALNQELLATVGGYVLSLLTDFTQLKTSISAASFVSPEMAASTLVSWSAATLHCEMQNAAAGESSSDKSLGQSVLSWLTDNVISVTGPHSHSAKNEILVAAAFAVLCDMLYLAVSREATLFVACTWLDAVAVRMESVHMSERIFSSPLLSTLCRLAATASSIDKAVTGRVALAGALVRLLKLTEPVQLDSPLVRSALLRLSAVVK